MRNLSTSLSTVLSLLLILSVAGCRNRELDKHASLHFTNDVVCPYTPVKNQGKSNACWIYAMLATIESEHIRRGDSVNLSPHYVIYQQLSQQALRRYLSRGTINYSQRGVAPMLLGLINEYGLMPYDSFHSEANILVTKRKMYRVVDECVARHTGFKAMKEKVDELLQNEIAPVPPHVYMFGVEYTPQEFAHSVCMPHEYVAMTSYQHHDFNTMVDLELPDNKQHSKFLNVDINTLVNIVVNTLKQGYPVGWEGDTIDPGFSFKRGVALLDQEHPCSQADRQRDFEEFRTTDDHCMELVGLAHDNHGKTYVICKNSWGTNNPYGGLMYMSLNYLRSKTVAIVINNMHITNQQ